MVRSGSSRDRTKSLPTSLRKTGIFAGKVGDFRRFQSLDWGDREFGDKVECAKSRDFRAYEAQVANCRRSQDWLADAGGFEPRYPQFANGL